MDGRILVTGGLGFLGSVFVRRALSRGASVLNVDVGTYAADPSRLSGVPSANLRTVSLNVTDQAFLDLVRRERPTMVVHFAAETHVTRGEWSAERFFRSNVQGTGRLLEAAEAAGVGLVVHVSTDEVYGPCPGRPFREEDKGLGEGSATSAYARSKALADDVARSFFGRLPVIIVRPTNCFGPWQHPEKAIPRWVTRALLGEPIPVWGGGGQVRDWMFVEDACDGIEAVIDRGRPGQVYNIAPEGAQRTNLEIAGMVARAAGRGPEDVYLTAYDRPDHDGRYAIDSSRLRALGWGPSADLEGRLADTVAWYRLHRDWWSPLRGEAESLYADAAPRGDR